MLAGSPSGSGATCTFRVKHGSLRGCDVARLRGRQSRAQPHAQELCARLGAEGMVGGAGPDGHHELRRRCEAQRPQRQACINGDTPKRLPAEKAVGGSRRRRLQLSANDRELGERASRGREPQGYREAVVGEGPPDVTGCFLAAEDVVVRARLRRRLSPRLAPGTWCERAAHRNPAVADAGKRAPDAQLLRVRHSLSVPDEVWSQSPGRLQAPP
mmetsp:Transcript_2483/g.4981  ORF Transcript_2483/g.4981 Transcript_2483/m.4981 type:complete len:214 (-) Transcript_2483:395-1036(-)